MDINLNNYRLVQPESVEHISNSDHPIEMVDISIEDDHLFYIVQGNGYEILSHNCDGSHIASLIVNMIHRWFPHIIRHGRLLKLETPIVVAKKGNQIKRYYSLDEFKKNNKGLTNVRYLKGLGSLSLSDWDFVFSNLKISKYIADDKATESLEMAFGEDVTLRKKWLTE